MQVDRQHMGGVLVGGKSWNGVGFYIDLNPPHNPASGYIPTLANMSRQLQMLGRQGVKMAMIYNLGGYSAAE